MNVIFAIRLRITHWERRGKTQKIIMIVAQKLLELPLFPSTTWYHLTYCIMCRIVSSLCASIQLKRKECEESLQRCTTLFQSPSNVQNVHVTWHERSTSCVGWVQCYTSLSLRLRKSLKIYVTALRNKFYRFESNWSLRIGFLRAMRAAYEFLRNCVFPGAFNITFHWNSWSGWFNRCSFYR